MQMDVHCPQSTVHCPLSTVCCPLSTVCCLMSTVCPLSALHCPPSTVHCPRSACLVSLVCCLLSDACCVLSPVCCVLTAVHCHCLTSTGYWSLSTVYCPLSTVHCPLSTVYCPLSTLQCIEYTVQAQGSRLISPDGLGTLGTWNIPFQTSNFLELVTPGYTKVILQSGPELFVLLCVLGKAAWWWIPWYSQPFCSLCLSSNISVRISQIQLWFGGRVCSLVDTQNVWSLEKFSRQFRLVEIRFQSF
jgi:hypothetical protein